MSTNTQPLYCNANNYVYKKFVNSNITFSWTWNKVSKIPGSSSVFANQTEYQAEEGEIIDVIRYIDSGGTETTSLIIFDSTVNPAYDPDYPKFYLRRAPIVGSNGSERMILLKTESSSSPNFMKVYCFNYVSEEVEVFDFEAPVCMSDSSLGTDNILKTKCSGYTRIQYRHDGNGGVTTTSVVNSPQCGYVAPVIQSKITQTQRIEVRKACKNPVYIKWKNTLGGWDQWVFEEKQTLSSEITSRGSFKKNVFDISETSNPIKELGKQAQPKMVLGAEGLSTQEKRALMHLLMSNKVCVLNKDMQSFREVRIEPGSFLVVETDQNFHSIEFTVIEPEINTIGN